MTMPVLYQPQTTRSQRQNLPMGVQQAWEAAYEHYCETTIALVRARRLAIQQAWLKACPLKDLAKHQNLVSSNRCTLGVAQKREIKALQAFIAIDQQAATLLATPQKAPPKGRALRACSRSLPGSVKKTRG